MRTLPSVILGSLVGAAVIHFGMMACSDSTRSAQAADCANYQIASFYQGPFDVANGLSATIDLPAGWEPIGASPYGANSTVGALVVIRRCKP